MTHTKNVLNKIRDDYASHPAVTAIELLNEPLGPSLNMDGVRQFYMDGWGNLKNSHVAITFHDAFEGVTSWNGWGAGMWSLILDTHHYEIFDQGSISMSPNEHISTACAFGSQMASTGKWTIAGEWTGGITDCAKWLNGLGKGARYDGTFDGSSPVGSCDGKYAGSVADLSSADKYNIGRFIEAQLDAFEKANGWIFWTWKTESAPEWHMKDLLANGLFPQPLTSRNCKSLFEAPAISLICFVVLLSWKLSSDWLTNKQIPANVVEVPFRFIGSVFFLDCRIIARSHCATRFCQPQLLRILTVSTHDFTNSGCLI